ncbi:MAG: hypothetical protein ABJB73_04750 [Candidatus Nitrosocosmicus sp.]
MDNLEKGMEMGIGLIIFIISCTDPNPTKARRRLNKGPCDIKREIPENILGMLLSSIVYIKLGPSLNFIAEVTIGPRVA